ncbi:hypothetical protein EUTSA_v10017492mg [Eutrema salsugineum]|uniref:Uncharacterized protein n=1 Tax=Eutrema salsugineum TaxID=72664 RepID=V4M4T2_EUTSA|nr:hypothetical protein EUTSA_v10017492mg [Eutrema salsugineum]
MRKNRERRAGANLENRERREGDNVGLAAKRSRRGGHGNGQTTASFKISKPNYRVKNFGYQKASGKRLLQGGEEDLPATRIQIW